MSVLFGGFSALIMVVIAGLQFTTIFQYGWGRWVIFSLCFLAACCIVASTCFGMRELARQRREGQRLSDFDDRLQTTLERIAADLAKGRAAEPAANRSLAPATLYQRVAELAHKLLLYLKEKEYAPLDASGDKWKYVYKLKLPLEKKIDAGYSNRFASSASTLRYEIRESGIDTSGLDALLDKSYHSSETIRELAAKLLEMSIRMERDERLKGN